MMDPDDPYFFEEDPFDHEDPDEQGEDEDS